MKIGIISDTHDEIDLTRKALELFKEKKIDMIIHAGDITSSKMLQLFKDFKCIIIHGNADTEIETLNREAEKLGFGKLNDKCEFIADNKKFLVIHGDNVPVFREAVSSNRYDYIIKGHTHFFEDYFSNEVRVLNPGSLCESTEHFIVIFDTEKECVERINVDN